MNLLRFLLLLLLLPNAAGAEPPPLPNPPVGHVLDRSGWLSGPDTNELETELSRLRKEHLIDVIVVAWDRSLPVDHDLDAFARRLGQSWAREDLWAVVLQMPDTVNRPAIAYEGAAIDSLRKEPVEAAIETAVDRGMKEWTEPARLSGVALNLAEELVYLRLRRQHEQNTIKKAQTKALAIAKQRKENLMIRVTGGIMATILLIGTVLAARLIIRRRRPAQLTFPETRWRRRLAAPWCGGSDLVTTFTPPDPR